VNANSVPAPSLGAPAIHSTAQATAYEAIRQAIMRGTLGPGTKLNQTALAAQLSLSTTPIREALRRLAGDGLVRIDQYRGAIVRELDQSELTDIYEARMRLEPLAIHKAIEKITARELDEAEQLCKRMDDHTDIDAWVEANRQFHAIFARVARSSILEPILKSLRDSAAPYVRLSIALDSNVQVTSNAEHYELLEAFGARDADRAAKIEVDHLRATLAVILNRWSS
jgi:Transcriptional regulators